MIEAVLTKRPGALRLEVSGHAGAAPAGRDLVCAAVSALSWACIGYVSELYGRGRLCRAPELAAAKGSAFICAQAKSEYADELNGAAGLVEAGLALLSENFPGNIKFETCRAQAGACRTAEFGAPSASTGREEIYKQ